MFSSKIKVLALSVLVLGAASTAFACGDKDKSASNAQASYASAEKAGCGSKTAATVASADKAGDACCAAKGNKAAMASANGCAAKGAKGSTVSLAGASCGSHSASKVAGAECDYGEGTVTMAGACPTKNEANYAFYVKDAECQGTGTAVAKAVKSVKGVAAVTVDYEKHMVYVCADSKSADKKVIEKSLKSAGYKDVKFVSSAKENCAKSHAKVEA